MISLLPEVSLHQLEITSLAFNIAMIFSAGLMKFLTKFNVKDRFESDRFRNPKVNTDHTSYMSLL